MANQKDGGPVEKIMELDLEAVGTLIGGVIVALGSQKAAREFRRYRRVDEPLPSSATTNEELKLALIGLAHSMETVAKTMDSIHSEVAKTAEIVALLAQAQTQQGRALERLLDRPNPRDLRATPHRYPVPPPAGGGAGQ